MKIIILILQEILYEYMDMQYCIYSLSSNTNVHYINNRTIIEFHFVVNYFHLLNLWLHIRKFILFINLSSGELSLIRVSVKKKRKNSTHFHKIHSL